MTNQGAGTLHILPRSPSHGASWQDCLATYQSADSLILIEDGVFGSADGADRFDTLPTDLQVFALSVDCAARGVLERVSSCVELIDDAEFVALVTRHRRSITWS